MGTFLLIGSCFGAIVGLLHGFHLFHRQGGPQGLYNAAWAVVLWTLLGAYVLAFWILGAIFMLVSQAFALRRMWAARGTT